MMDLRSASRREAGRDPPQPAIVAMDIHHLPPSRSAWFPLTSSTRSPPSSLTSGRCRQGPPAHLSCTTARPRICPGDEGMATEWRKSGTRNMESAARPRAHKQNSDDTLNLSLKRQRSLCYKFRYAVDQLRNLAAEVCFLVSVAAQSLVRCIKEQQIEYMAAFYLNWAAPRFVYQACENNERNKVKRENSGENQFEDK
ncbi:hypothetical protein EJB05_00792 [Eragrostis curvula]|uniref:Uncharacterized protein n=1 Tax=Eragrostis curvula TaxID=38414 RepID=A0A5J9WMS1_9POAL|nr:hypothetical protein EJB05_00792 [Eragrostis curvula]